MDRGAWQATAHRVTKLDTTEVTDHARTYSLFTCNSNLTGHLIFFLVFVAQLCVNYLRPHGL